MAISGNIVNPGDVINITYTNKIQQWEVPVDGLYLLEVYGARGGNIPSGQSGGQGGYSKGYALLKKGTILYIVTGGAGVGYVRKEAPYGTISGGYNGGGLIRRDNTGGEDCATGGGATHIATRSGLLSELKNYKSTILLVAGGGGGAFGDADRGTYKGGGGAGGGTTGGDGKYGGDLSGFRGRGGTQSAAGAGGGPSDRTLVAGGFGYGGSISPNSESVGYVTGGGGGYYGGGAGGGYCGGGGGSGYIGGVPSIEFQGTTYSPSTKQGGTTGNGSARITFVKPEGIYNLYHNGTQIKSITGKDVTEVRFNGNMVFKTS